jgi:hypothetical protein
MYDDRDNSILINGRRGGNGRDFTGAIGFDDMFLMKLDTAGNFKWGKLYGATGNDQVFGLCKGIGNNYILAGTAHDDTNNLDRAAILNIDVNGTLLDQKIITGDWGHSFIGVFPYKGSFGAFGHSGSLKLSECTGQNCPFGIHGSGALSLSKIELWKTGIEEPNGLAVESYIISPNPSNSEFEIRFSEQVRPGTLTCVNTLGAVVARRKVEAGTGKVTVATNSWQRGNYVVCWQPDGRTQISKSITIY